MIVKALICIAVLALSGCTQNVGSTRPPEASVNVKTPGASPLPVEPLSAAAPNSEAPVTVVGEFSNRKGDGEHAWGYSVELWKHDGRIIGMISGTDYLMLNGSPPTGLLEDVQYDPKTGRMSFSAKLSLHGGRDSGSHDMYLFDGVLTPSKMKGVITVKGEANCTDCGEKIKVVLPRLQKPVADQESYKTLDEWNAYKDMILDFRGPRW
jgi:hypothetical protein